MILYMQRGVNKAETSRLPCFQANTSVGNHMHQCALLAQVPLERPARTSFDPRAHVVGLSPGLLRVGSESFLSSTISPVVLGMLSVAG